MTIILLTMFSALAVSAVAAYFSVIGLMAIFASAPIPIAVMGASLELAKLVTASWIYRNWKEAPGYLKYYFIIAVVILSLITSMGIFGYLSKAHLDQAVPSNDVLAKVTLLDEKISIEKENIDTSRKSLKQMDESVDQVMNRSSDSNGADKAVNLRRTQQKERARLLSEIDTAQKHISVLNQERSPIASELRKVEAEVGPLKYIAAFLYGDNPDTNMLERAVRLVIVLIVIVFDPLAILLIIASNYSLKNYRKEKESPVDPYIKIDPIIPAVKEPSAADKESWSKELYSRLQKNSKVIDTSRIHSIPKEIMDKVFHK